jgi:plasmid stabilization system protein ParE
MKIEWTEPAISDLDGIRNYIGRGSEYYAARFIGRIIEAVERLEYFPEMGRRVPEAEEENVRELLFQNYRVDPQRILVLTVIHAARDVSQKEPKPWDVA